MSRVTRRGNDTIMDRARIWNQAVCWERLWCLHLYLLECFFAFETFLRKDNLVHSLEKGIGIGQVGVMGRRRWEEHRVFQVLQAAWAKDMGVWTLLVGMQVLRRGVVTEQVPDFSMGVALEWKSKSLQMERGRGVSMHPYWHLLSPVLLSPHRKDSTGLFVINNSLNQIMKQLVVFWVSLQKYPCSTDPPWFPQTPLYVDLSKLLLNQIMLLAPSLAIRSYLTPLLKCCTFYLPWIYLM